jgi:hypothetical protein
VVNLVFMRPVHSRIKLWQMIGRGTRNQQACRYFDRLPDGEKTRFVITDFWQNDFGKQTEERVPSEMPLLTRLFNTRLDILTTTSGVWTQEGIKLVCTGAAGPYAPLGGYSVAMSGDGTTPSWAGTGDREQGRGPIARAAIRFRVRPNELMGGRTLTSASAPRARSGRHASHCCRVRCPFSEVREEVRASYCRWTTT